MNNSTNNSTKKISKLLLSIISVNTISCATDVNSVFMESDKPEKSNDPRLQKIEYSDINKTICLNKDVKTELEKIIQSDYLKQFFGSYDKLRVSMAYLLAQMDNRSNLVAKEESLKYCPSRLNEIFEERMNNIVCAINEKKSIGSSVGAVNLYHFIEKKKENEDLIKKYFANPNKITKQEIFNFLYENEKVDIGSEEKQFPQRKTEFANFAYNFKNGNKDVNDGFKYRGSGYLQLTGRENFEKSSNWLKNNFGEKFAFFHNPDILREDITFAIISGVGFFGEKKLFAKIGKEVNEQKVSDIYKIVSGDNKVKNKTIKMLTKKTQDFLAYLEFILPFKD